MSMSGCGRSHNTTVDSGLAYRLRRRVNHELGLAARKGSLQVSNFAVRPAEEACSIDVDDQRIMAVDKIGDPPRLDRVAPGFDVPPEPGRKFARA